MRIAIAAGTLRGAGSGMVGHEVVSHLLRDNPGDEFLVWGPAEWQGHGGWPTTRTSIVHGTRPGQWRKFANEILEIPRVCRRQGVDALLSMGDTGAPRPGVPHVLFVQQAYLAAPMEALDFPMSAAFRLRLRAMAAYFQAGLPQVTRFTVQSTFMKSWLTRRWGIDADRIDVTPSAPSPEVRGLRCAPAYDPEPYVVFLSSPGPHKNHAVIPRVMRHLKDGGSKIRCRLTIRAEDATSVAQEAARLGVADSVEFLGRATRNQAAQLLAGALAHVVPSRLESFGLGVLEALAIGCPVIAADRHYAREMCGGAAMYADPDDAPAFAEHIAALADSATTWQETSAAALRRHAEIDCDWGAIALRYRTLLGESAQ